MGNIDMADRAISLQVIERERGSKDSKKALKRILIENYDSVILLYEEISQEKKERFRAALYNISEDELKRGSTSIKAAL